MSSKIKVSPKVDSDSNKLTCNPVNNISVVIPNNTNCKFRKEFALTGSGSNGASEAQTNTDVLYPSVKPLYDPPMGYQTRDINLEETTTTTTSDYSSEYTTLKKAYDTIESEKHKLENQNEALNIIIGIMQDNPTYVNKLILADDEKLCEMLRLLCDGAESVNIDADELSTCFAKTYRTVNAIYVNVYVYDEETGISDGTTKTENLKYAFPDVCKYMKELGINLKVVW